MQASGMGHSNQTIQLNSDLKGFEGGEIINVSEDLSDLSD